MQTQEEVKLAEYGWRPQPVYIAVCKHGYGVSTKPAMAIWRALRSVPFKSKRSQMLIY